MLPQQLFGRVCIRHFVLTVPRQFGRPPAQKLSHKSTTTLAETDSDSISGGGKLTQIIVERMTQMNRISEGDMAPDFTLPTDGGGSFSLSENSGKGVVLFFYPKDDTSGCTKEAIGFSETRGEFEKLGFAVVGMSPDPVKKHDKFRDKHDLKITLISDEEKEVLGQYGVWVEKSMYGKKYMGVERTTLLIGADRVVAKAWHKVKVPGHVDEVLAEARALSG